MLTTWKCESYMGVMFAHTWPQMQSSDHFERVFGAFHSRYEQAFALYHNHGNTSELIGANTEKGESTSQQSHVDSFLESTQ